MLEYSARWYDGVFFDAFAGSFRDKVFGRVKENLSRASTVLNIGCRTGRLASKLLGKCDRLEIVDPSETNVGITRRKLAGVSGYGIDIECADPLDFVERSSASYDYVVVSYLLHQINDKERDVLLWALSTVADQIIVIDYLVPQPKNYCSFVNYIVEYAAGPLHYGNFKSFVEENGISGVLEKVPLNVISDLRHDDCSSHIVVLEGKNRHKPDRRPVNIVCGLPKVTKRIEDLN